MSIKLKSKVLKATFAGLLFFSSFAHATKTFNCDQLINGNTAGLATDNLVQVPGVKLTISEESLNTLIIYNSGNYQCATADNQKPDASGGCKYNTSALGDGETPITVKSDTLIESSFKYGNIDNCVFCSSALFVQSFDPASKQLRTSLTLTRVGVFSEVLYDIVRQCN